MYANRIKHARKVAKMTQSDLAKLLDVNRATISKYETGEIVPSIEMLGYISNALDCDVEYLLGYSNDIRITATTKKLIAAMERKDAREVERLMGLPTGTIFALPSPDEMDVTLTDTKQINTPVKEYTNIDVKRLKATVILALIELQVDKQVSERFIDAFMLLTPDGQQKAVERVEELTEIPKYQRKNHQHTLITPLENSDTTSFDNSIEKHKD